MNDVKAKTAIEMLFKYMKTFFISHFIIVENKKFVQQQKVEPKLNAVKKNISF